MELSLHKERKNLERKAKILFRQERKNLQRKSKILFDTRKKKNV